MSAPFSVPPTARPSEQRDREKLMATAVNSTASHRFTNHDRINTQPAAAATLSTSTVGQEPSGKITAPLVDPTQRLPPIAVDSPVSQPALRRIKTESSTLSMSTKQYFQRRERERVERDAVKTELNPVKMEQEPSKSSPANVKLVLSANKVESDIVKSEPRNKQSGNEFGVKTDMKPTTNDSVCKPHNTDLKLGPNRDIASGQNTSLRGHLPTSTSRGIGDASNQRPSNIFESFHVSDSQPADGSSTVASTHALPVPSAQQAGEVTPVPVADSIDLGAILKPEHVHGGDYSLELPVFTSSATGVSSTVVSSNSSLSVSHGHHGTHSTTSNRSRQRVHGQHSRERRRSTRHEGSTSLLSPSKQPNPTDQRAASEISRRRRPSNSSQPSPLKMKLSLTGTSHSGSPTIVKQADDSSESTKIRSHVSSPLLESQNPSLSDSQEHIRLKLNVSSGRVEKLGNAVVSPSMTTGVKLVLSKDKVSGEYQHGSSSESGHHHHHHRRHHGHHHHHHKHSRPDTDAAHSAHTHAEVSRKRAADFSSTVKPHMEKKLRSEFGNGHQSVVSGRLSQTQTNQVNNIGLSRTHIPSTYRVSGIPSTVPPPPPPPLPTEEPAPPPPPPLPPH